MVHDATHPPETSTSQADEAPVVLVIGATGGIGGEVAKQLLRGGWRVRALTRHADMASRVERGARGLTGLAGITWHVGDAMHHGDVLSAANGVHFIVHAANPPRYHRWRETALPMLSNAIDAARSSGARLVLPGNLYNFGPDAGACVNEDAPQHPLTRKGQVRVEMEQLLREAAASRDRAARSLVVRAGDFFGAHAPSSWFQTLMVRPGRRLRRVVYLGRPGIGHAWAYLPDLAATMCRLMALDWRSPGTLHAHEVVHFGGHWMPDGIEMAHAVRRASGQTEAPIRAFPWRWLWVLSPFMEVLREMREMRYLWEVPLRLDNRKLLSLLGQEPHTPLDEAVRASLAGLHIPVGAQTGAGARPAPAGS